MTSEQRRMVPIMCWVLIIFFSALSGPSEVPAETRGSEPAVLLSQALLRDGMPDSAVVILKHALKTDSSDIALLLALADAQGEARQMKGRRATLDRVMRLQRHSIEAQIALSEDFLASKNLDSAAYFAHEVLANSGRSSADGYYLLGRVHEQAGRADSALLYYRGAWMLLPVGELY